MENEVEKKMIFELPNMDDLVALAIQWVGRVFIGSTDSISQEEDFYAPVGDRYVQNTEADAKDQSIMRSQLYGEYFRQLLDYRITTIGVIGAGVLCAVLLMIASGLTATGEKWQEAKADREKATAQAEAKEKQEKAAAKQAKGEALAKTMFAGADPSWEDACRSIFITAYVEDKDPGENDNYAANCQSNQLGSP